MVEASSLQPEVNLLISGRNLKKIGHSWVSLIHFVTFMKSAITRGSRLAQPSKFKTKRTQISPHRSRLLISLKRFNISNSQSMTAMTMPMTSLAIWRQPWVSSWEPNSRPSRRSWPMLAKLQAVVKSLCVPMPSSQPTRLLSGDWTGVQSTTIFTGLWVCAPNGHNGRVVSKKKSQAL